MPNDKPACTCIPFSQDAGGGYFEHLLEPNPGCPVHFPKTEHDKDALIETLRRQVAVPIRAFDHPGNYALALEQIFERYDAGTLDHSYVDKGCECGYDHRIPLRFSGVGRTDG